MNFIGRFLRNFEQISEVVFQISVKSNHILHDSSSLSFSGYSVIKLDYSYSTVAHISDH